MLLLLLPDTTSPPTLKSTFGRRGAFMKEEDKELVNEDEREKKLELVSTVDRHMSVFLSADCLRCSITSRCVMIKDG